VDVAGRWHVLPRTVTAQNVFFVVAGSVALDYLLAAPAQVPLVNWWQANWSNFFRLLVVVALVGRLGLGWQVVAGVVARWLLFFDTLLELGSTLTLSSPLINQARHTGIAPHISIISLRKFARDLSKIVDSQGYTDGSEEPEL
jgi:hypothetical protein